jgi:hypothetical protein
LLLRRGDPAQVVQAPGYPDAIIRVAPGAEHGARVGDRLVIFAV